MIFSAASAANIVVNTWTWDNWLHNNIFLWQKHTLASDMKLAVSVTQQCCKVFKYYLYWIPNPSPPPVKIWRPFEFFVCITAIGMILHKCSRELQDWSIDVKSVHVKRATLHQNYSYRFSDASPPPKKLTRLWISVCVTGWDDCTQKSSAVHDSLINVVLVVSNLTHKNLRGHMPP